MALFENKSCIECEKVTLIEYDKDKCIDCRASEFIPEDEIIKRLIDIRDLIVALKG